MSGLPPVFIEFLGKSRGVKMAMADVKTELGATAAESETSFSRFGRVSSAAVAGIGLAAAGAAVGAIKMAADFQQQMTRVRTGAGETAGNMKLVSDGVLAMAGQVGQSTEQLTSGLYLVESAGYHGAAALNVLKIAAMGAKVGNADLGTTADAVTTAMNAYKMGSSQAAQAMNALIATEGQGKTNLEALAGSMATILPTAAAAHVGLNEVLGAMATMTAQGTPAADAATYLRQTISQLSNPSTKAAKEMAALGLSSVQVTQNLGKHGLASTLDMLTSAIEQHMGPAGTVLIQTLQKASHSSKSYHLALAHMTTTQQTYIGALADMVGGTRAMQGALELTGPHLVDFKSNTATIAQHVKAGGQSVEGWAQVQKNFNQQLAEAKDGFQAMVIQIGTAMLPVATRAMGVIAHLAQWLTRNKTAATVLAGVIGALLAGAVLKFTFSAAKPLVDTLGGVWKAAKSAKQGISMLRQGFQDAQVANSAFSGAMGTIGGKLRSAVTGVRNLAGAGWSKIAKGAGSAAGKIGDLAAAGWEKVASGASAVASGMKDAAVAAGRWVIQAAAATLALLRQAAAWLGEKIALVASTIAEGAMTAAQWLLNVALDANPIMLIVLAIAALIAGLVLAYQHVGWFRALVNGAFKLVGQVALWLWHDVLEPAFRGIGAGAVWLWHAMSSAFAWIVHAGEGAARWIAGLPGRILGWFADAGKWLLDAGVHLIEGLWHGIESMGSWITSQITGFIKDVVPGPVLSVLGIHSPSRVFMEIGRHVVSGLSLGITGNADQAALASARMAAKVAAAAGTGSLSVPGLAGAPGATGLAQAAAGAGVAQVTTIVQLDGEELFRVMQPHALRNDRRNPQPGLVYVH